MVIRSPHPERPETRLSRRGISSERKLGSGYLCVIYRTRYADNIDLRAFRAKLKAITHTRSSQLWNPVCPTKHVPNRLLRILYIGIVPEGDCSSVARWSDLIDSGERDHPDFPVRELYEVV